MSAYLSEYSLSHPFAFASLNISAIALRSPGQDPGATSQRAIRLDLLRFHHATLHNQTSRSDTKTTAQPTRQQGFLNNFPAFDRPSSTNAFRKPVMPEVLQDHFDWNGESQLAFMLQDMVSFGT